MQIQPVRADRVDDALRIGDGDAVIELDRADVREQDHARRHFADAIGRDQTRVLDSRALAAQSERNARALGRHGQIEIDRARPLGAAGHR